MAVNNLVSRTWICCLLEELGKILPLSADWNRLQICQDTLFHSLLLPNRLRALKVQNCGLGKLDSINYLMTGIRFQPGSVGNWGWVKAFLWKAGEWERTTFCLFIREGDGCVSVFCVNNLWKLMQTSLHRKKLLPACFVQIFNWLYIKSDRENCLSKDIYEKQLLARLLML